MTLQTDLIAALTGRSPPNYFECPLFKLPTRTCGLNITIPSKQADEENLSSLRVTSALQDHIILQDGAYGYEIIDEQLQSERSVKLASEKG